MKKILIVIPKIANRYTDYTFPVGAAYVVATLKAAGFQVDCLNLSHHQEPLESLLRQRIPLSNYLFSATAGLSSQYPQVEQVVSTLKRLTPQLPVSVGGGLVSSLPELSVRELRADFGIVGEGEITMVELAQALQDGRDPQHVAGLVIRDPKSGQTSQTAARPPIDNLDSLPFPDLEALGFNEMLDWQLPTSSLFCYYFDQPRVVPLISSRSCPYNCTFCFHPLGRKYRQRSLPNIFAEIDHIVSAYQANIIMVYDELFAERKDRARVREFCQHMKERGLKWIAQLRVDMVDEDLLRLFKDSGCLLISYGIESGSQTILDSMHKHTTVPQIDNALALTQKIGIGMTGTVLFGDPAETQDTFLESYGWWLRNRQYRIPLTPIYIYPGSVMYTVAKSKGLIGDEAAYMKIPYPIINNTTLTNDSFNYMMHMMEVGRQQLSHYPGLLLRASSQGRDRFGRHLMALKARCPHCLAVNDYRNLHHVPQRFKFLSIGCRNCHQRYDLPSIEELASNLTKSKP